MITGKDGESAVVALNQKLTKGGIARKESGIPPSPTKRVTTDPSPGWRSPYFAEWKTDTIKTRAGFPNTDGTLCYRNVTFQMLLHLPILLHFVECYRLKHVPTGVRCWRGNGINPCKVCMFHDFARGFWDVTNGGYNYLFDILWYQVFKDWQDGANTGQQDPAEFFPEFYRQLHEHITPMCRTDLELILRPSIVTIRSCEGANACDPTSTQSEDIFLRVPFPSKPHKATIQNALDSIFVETKLGVRCDTCKGKLADTDRLGHAPEVILVQLNRIDVKKGVSKKIGRPIEFGEKIKFQADYQLDTKEYFEYELSSVQMHQGTTPQEGHYYIAVRGNGGEWTLVDDEKLTAYETLNELIEDNDEIRQEAYIFAYRRLPTDPTMAALLPNQKDAAAAIRRDSTPISIKNGNGGDINVDSGKGSRKSPRPDVSTEIDLEREERGLLKLSWIPGLANEGNTQPTILAEIRGPLKNLPSGGKKRKGSNNGNGGGKKKKT